MKVTWVHLLNRRGLYVGEPVAGKVTVYWETGSVSASSLQVDSVEEFSNDLSDPDIWLTVGETANLFGIGRQGIHDAIKDQRIRAVKFHGLWMVYRRDAEDQWRDRRVKTSESE